MWHSQPNPRQIEKSTHYKEYRVNEGAVSSESTFTIGILCDSLWSHLACPNCIPSLSVYFWLDLCYISCQILFPRLSHSVHYYHTLASSVTSLLKSSQSHLRICIFIIWMCGLSELQVDGLLNSSMYSRWKRCYNVNYESLFFFESNILATSRS